MAEATLVREWDQQRIVAAASISVGDVWQMPDGQAAVYVRISRNFANPATAAGIGDPADFRTSGKYTLPLTGSITILDGGRVYWDHSANLAHYKKVNDRDFYLGRAVGDSSGGIVVVDLNADKRPDIDLLRDGYLSVPV